MKSLEKIPTEIIQKISPYHAWEYKIVPGKIDSDILVCYGSDKLDWNIILEEVEVITGEKLKIIIRDEGEIIRLLKNYYRLSNDALKSNHLTINGDKFLIQLIDEAYKSYASDIHFEVSEVKSRVRFRIDGKLIERYIIEKQNYPAIVNQIKILAGLDISEKRLPQDGRISYESGNEKFDVRVSSLPTIYGEKIVLRLLTRHVELLELVNLGFSERQLKDYTNAVKRPNGLVLISGPTGSGKSTTLYATLRMLNNETDNILTIEDPVEYTLEGINQVQLKEEIGLTFDNALRTFLRQDPDIIMLGEIRDSDTAHMAIRSSLTGHLLLSTLHTNSAWGSVARLIDMGVHPYLISNALILCVAQRLVRILCPKCKLSVPINRSILTQIGGTCKNTTHHFQAVGCEYCFYTGYKGRKAIYEVIPIDKELSEAIRTSNDDITKELQLRGITNLKESILDLFLKGETSLDELLPQFN